jgi:hypothetical protein
VLGGARTAYGRKNRLIQGFWWGNLRERDHFGHQDVDGMIILKWIFKKWDVWAWTGLILLRIKTGGWHL